jgi:UDP-glucuronate 4-epimerase
MDAIRLVEELVGKKAMLEYKPRHPADMLATWADIRKAGQLLGWRPRVTFQQGVQQLVEWYQLNSKWAHEVGTI